MKSNYAYTVDAHYRLGWGLYSGKEIGMEGKLVVEPMYIQYECMARQGVAWSLRLGGDGWL